MRALALRRRYTFVCVCSTYVHVTNVVINVPMPTPTDLSSSVVNSGVFPNSVMFASTEIGASD